MFIYLYHVLGSTEFSGRKMLTDIFFVVSVWFQLHLPLVCS